MEWDGVRFAVRGFEGDTKGEEVRLSHMGRQRWEKSHQVLKVLKF